MDINTNFIAGKMNKSVDERLVPKGQYIDALNVRLGSTETTEIGAVENSKGNTILTDISYDGVTLSSQAKCIGAFEDGVNENIYWFVHDPTSAMSGSLKVDMILSFNTTSQSTTYHVISETVLNFNPNFLITGINLLEDLLFFTDDFNPPRKINITRSYPAPGTSGDLITEEELNVIVKPPGFSSYVTSLGVTEYELTAPTISLSNVVGDENFIKDKFICFAYRYQYLDNEYSATSLFTKPAFSPGLFTFEFGNYYNSGMENEFNSVDINFNTGGPLVIAVELLFKESAKNTINVIERFNKSDLGWSDNSIQSFRFTNSKIYTVLGSDELLRTYDNVPRLAQAQTIMGNRLVYGNYVDQYNIETIDKQPISIDYEVAPVSDRITNSVVFPNSFQNGLVRGAYNYINPAIVPPATGGYVPFSTAGFVLDNYSTVLGDTVPLPIQKFSQISIQLNITSTAAYGSGVDGYKALTGNASNPDFPATFKTNTLGSPLKLTATVVARNTYNTYSDFLNSIELAEAVGTGVPGTPGSTITEITTPAQQYGFSLSDQFYSKITPPAGFDFTTAGLWTAASTQDGFRQAVTSSNSTDDTLILQVPSVHYSSNTGSGTNVYEYFAFTYTSVFPIVNPPRGATTDSSLNIRNSLDFFSLHSNRNYEAGIMYMDDYGRATTVLVAPNNTAFFPASTSVDLNVIKAYIYNKPPYWATKYKFLLKPSLLNYDTIYSNSIFTDELNASISWVRLEGYAGSIVNKGDILTVKIQSNGTVVNTFLETTVLEVVAKARGGATGEENLPSGAPGGLYMKIQPRGFVASTQPNSLIDTGFIEDTVTGTSCNPLIRIKMCCEEDSLGNNVNYTIPVGASIEMTFRGWRSRAWWGVDSINTETVPYRYEIIASQAASDFKDFWDQEGLNPSSFMRSDGELDIDAVYYPQINANPQSTDDTIQFWFEQSSPGAPSSALFLVVRLNNCSKSIAYDQRPVHVEGQIVINKNSNLMAFETKPDIADADLYYDSSEMYNIIPDVNGDLAHMGDSSASSQNQVISSNTPAIVTLPFSDCYTFGNGIESYRYRDLPTTNFFRIGERVSAVSNSLFKEADRFAGLTYSGVYSGSSNVNNLNEFNLGLVNFKDCELIFGPIKKLHARQTDILVLQEDRISYVLANKNLISDSVGGGAIIASPTILGQQVARIEEYGISFNPESFTSWGRDMYFSDTKRGAIIKLTGSSAESDSLEVVSTYGMRSYFRDKFVDQLNTQKLGGYDPYMNEYVFSSNNIAVPTPVPVSSCGAQLEKLNTTAPLTVTVDVTTATGTFDIIINPQGSMDVNVVVEWNNITTTNNNLTAPTTITIDKDQSFPTTATVTVTANEKSSYKLFLNCVATQTLNVVSVVLGSPISGLIGSGAQTLHYEYRWSGGGYTSPLESNQVTFSGTSNVSEYVINTGQTSIGMYPGDGATITMRTNKIIPDTYTFDSVENRFYAITDNALPPSTGSGFDLSLLTGPLAPITGSIPDDNGVDTLYQATSSAITISASTKTLYLVWDLRDRQNSDFCYSSVSQSDACVGCSVNMPCIGPANFIMDPAVQTTAALACNGGNGPNGTWFNNPGAYQGFWHSQPPGVPSTNEPNVGDIAYKACGSNPANCCLGGVPADPGYYFSRAQSVIEIGANGEVLSVDLFPCN